jgi:hypothetical protein
VDGEGCFSLGLVRQAGGVNRAAYRSGYQIFHEFVVTQGARSVGCLYRLQQFFGVGGVIENRRLDNHRENVHRYAVRRRDHLTGVVIPFFQEYPLRSAKQEDFEKFAVCVAMMSSQQHLTASGFADIVGIVETMNRRKPRTGTMRILRGHTPDA